MLIYSSFNILLILILGFLGLEIYGILLGVIKLKLILSVFIIHNIS
jgi:hypothetical protein